VVNEDNGSRGLEECNHGCGEPYLLSSAVYTRTEDSPTTGIFKNITRAIWMYCAKNARLSFTQDEKNDLTIVVRRAGIVL
jgi:hypothetical protein